MLLSEYGQADEQFRAFVARLMRECPPIIQRHTIAFFGEQDGKQIQCGSGVLLQVGGQHFVLTAAHVLDLLLVHSIPLFLMPGEAGKKLISLTGAVFYSSEMPSSRSRNDDVMDVGFVELTAPTASELVPGKTFLRLKDIDVRDPFYPKSWYLTAGYPSEVNVSDYDRRTHTSTLLAYASWPYYGERGFPDYFRQEFDLFVHYMRNDSTEGDENVLASVPEPEGVSGCGMWRLASADKPIESWNPDDIRLIGIQRSWSKKFETLRGVRVAHPLAMMAESLPALTPYFRLNGMM